jgi:uncharacterized integral membrane protein
LPPHRFPGTLATTTRELASYRRLRPVRLIIKSASRCQRAPCSHAAARSAHLNRGHLPMEIQHNALLLLSDIQPPMDVLSSMSASLGSPPLPLSEEALPPRPKLQTNFRSEWSGQSKSIACVQPSPGTWIPPPPLLPTAFSGFVAGAIVLILLLIFILENTQSVKISYLGASGHVALGVAVLLAAVGGALLVGILGAARIAQVRRHAKRHPGSRRH